MPAVVFLLFLTMPILAAFLLDTDMFVLFLILFCVVGGLSTSSADPLAASRHSDEPEDTGPRTGTCEAPGRHGAISGFRLILDEHCPRAGSP